MLAPSVVQILAKAEFLNPGGSVKDRVALHIIQDAFAQGLLQEGGLITEGTAGSTGLVNTWALHYMFWLQNFEVNK